MKNQLKPIQYKSKSGRNRPFIMFLAMVPVTLSLCGLLFISSCKTSEDCEDNPAECTVEDYHITPDMSQSEIQDVLISVPDNQTVRFGAGTYYLTSSLTVEGKNDIKIIGEGPEITILNFEGQTEGGEGISVANCLNFEIAHIAIEEAKGDGIKVKDSKNVRFNSISAVWKTDKSTDNGAYGIYPVLCKNVLVENCYAKGSSDAGIYVGQSTNAVIKNCYAEKNVIGIEVENTINADVYDNELVNNAGGIFILDLQNLTQTGKKTRVFNNQITNNNYDNFAEKGTIAEISPAGTGILLLASREAEIFNNTFADNNLIGIGIVNYLAVSKLTEEPITDPNFDPTYNDIYIHDNTFSKNNELNIAGQSDLGLLVMSIFGTNPIPHIVCDGIFSPSASENGGICLNNNTGASFVNLDIANDFAGIAFDDTPHQCEGKILEPTNLDN